MLSRNPGYHNCRQGNDFIPAQASEGHSSQKSRTAADISQPDRKPELGFRPEPVVEDSEVKTEVQALIMVGTG